MSAQSENFDLCDSVFCSIVDAFGENTTTMPFRCDVVRLVWYTSGVVSNGGFEYLFDVSIDPCFTKSASAYHEIGALRAYEAFQNAMSLFPGGAPPKSASKRGRIYRMHPEDRRNQIDFDFTETDDEIVSCLASYIRRHRDEIEECIKKANAGT